MLTKKIDNKELDSLRIKSDPLITKMINLLMRNGKRSKAEKVLSKAFQALDKAYPGKASDIFYLAILNVKQDIAVRIKPKPKKRRNKQSYDTYIPRVISSSGGLNIGIRSLLKASKERSRGSFLPLWDSLRQELLKASQEKGEVISKRYETNLLALSNRRRVHFGVRR